MKQNGAVSVIVALWFVWQVHSAEALKLTPAQAKATADLTDYFRRVTARLADDCLDGVKTREDWEGSRGELRRQLLYMLGLDPLPKKTPLNAKVTGMIEGDTFVVEKLHYQSRPGLYVTGNFYRPKNANGPLPTILYVCGHSRVVVDGVACGAKAAYQHHAAWFARHGYNCLVIDTLQMGEIEGLHHGTYREGLWWWPARGYTPEGVEAWNCVRAIDYLATRPEVDMTKIGVTGRSGGGAYSWFSAAIDDRIAVSVPVAGVTDLQNHVVDGTIEGHCDCMFMVNTYQWDFGALAALTAPRPLLFSNSDKDNIFPLDGVVRTHAKVKRIYDLLGASDKLGLLITEGPHSDTQELQVPAFRWFNRWLKGTTDPITRPADKPFTPQQLKVFDELPNDQINTKIHETFVPPADVPLPKSKTEWEAQGARLLTELRDKCFRAWPNDPPAIDARVVAEREAGGLRLQVIEHASEENLRFTTYVVSGAKQKPNLLVVNVADSTAWSQWLDTHAAGFADALPGASDATPNGEAFAAQSRLLNANPWALAVVAPRGLGPNQWNPDPRKDTQIQRRFVLLGATADSARVWDVRRAIEALRATEYEKTRLWLQGKGTGAGLALYAGLFEPSVERFDLHEPTTSHMTGPYFLNVLRVLDVPQALALAYPRPVKLYDTEAGKWGWATKVARLYDENRPPLELRTTSK